MGCAVRISFDLLLNLGGLNSTDARHWMFVARGVLLAARLLVLKVHSELDCAGAEILDRITLIGVFIMSPRSGRPKIARRFIAGIGPGYQL